MAQEFYGLFDSTTGDERSYTAAQLAQVFRALARSGVSDTDACLKVSAPGGMTTQVAPGRAMICGYVYALSDDGGAALTFTHTASAASPRIDRVVLRLSVAEKSIALAVKTGVPAANPVPPALTRTALIYELSLARVLIPAASTEIASDQIIDERADESVCGPCVCAANTRTLLDARYAVPMATASQAGQMSPAQFSGLAALLAAITPSQTAIDLGGKYIDNALFR